MKRNPAKSEAAKILLRPTSLEGLNSSSISRSVLEPKNTMVFHVLLASGELVYGSIEAPLEREKTARQISQGSLFREKSLILAAPQHVHIIRTEAIVRVDIYSDELLMNSNPHEAAIWKEVTENYYLTEASNRQISGQSRDVLIGKSGAVISVLARLDLANCEAVFLTIDVSVPTQGEQRRFLNDFFEFSSFAFRRLDGGISLVNPSQINSSQFYPGAQPPAQAWNVSNTQIQPK
jgi:hypothetical protein